MAWHTKRKEIAECGINGKYAQDTQKYNEYQTHIIEIITQKHDNENSDSNHIRERVKRNRRGGMFHG
jgi:hypothetical protein